MNRIVIIFALLLCPLSLHAQSRAFDCDKDSALPIPEGRELVAKVQDEYAKTKTLRGNFFQDSYNAALEMSEAATGKFYFAKPGRMRWDYETPTVQTFLVRDTTLWLYQEAERQVLIDQFDKVLLSDLPVAFLMGLGNLKEDFELLKACRVPDGTVLELKSKTKKKEDLASFKLLIGRGSLLPAGASVTDVGGNETAILLTSVQFNPDLAPDRFEAQFPKGVDVQDRRSGAHGEAH